MSIAITPNFGDVITQTERLAYLAGFYGGPMEWLGFLTQTSGNYDIKGTQLNPAGSYSTHTEGTPVTTASPEEGYSATPRKERYSIGYAFSAEMWAKMDPTVKARFMESLAAAGARRYIESCYDMINRATSYTSNPDGKALLANDHPGNAGAQDNLTTSALDFSEAATGRQAVMQQQGPDGQKLGLRPSVGLAALALEGTVYKLRNATHQAADDRSDPNFVSSFGIDWHVSDYIDDSTRWVIASPEGVRNLQLHTTMAPGVVIQSVPLTKGDLAAIDEMSMQTLSWDWRGWYGK